MTASHPLLASLETATARLLHTASSLSADELTAPSLLPEWSRAHVVGHLARNADSHIRLTDGHAQYPSAASREEGIASTAALGPDALLADLCESCARLATCWDELPDWSAQRAEDDPRPISVLIGKRLLEVEVHHVDLASGYTPADWSAAFAGSVLDDASARMSHGTPLRLVAADGPGTWLVGAGSGVTELHGSTTALAAWLIGRSDGSAITVGSGGELPTPPPWF